MFIVLAQLVRGDPEDNAEKKKTDMFHDGSPLLLMLKMTVVSN
jgi:hypothetical protein